jgi:hypothetical protein
VERGEGGTDRDRDPGLPADEAEPLHFPGFDPVDHDVVAGDDGAGVGELGVDGDGFVGTGGGR